MEVYKSNVVSYFFTTVVFFPLLVAVSCKRPGHSAAVINISSISWINEIGRNRFKYSVSKAAMIQLNQLLAKELSRPGVNFRINAIVPGGVIVPSEMITKEFSGANNSDIQLMVLGMRMGSQS
jgi:NAD(P)-dependent dehydrogenase (short-subunit alcohol dehydrogenase family)